MLTSHLLTAGPQATNISVGEEKAWSWVGNLLSGVRSTERWGLRSPPIPVFLSSLIQTFRSTAARSPACWEVFLAVSCFPSNPS